MEKEQQNKRGIIEEDSAFCNWLAVEHPEQYKKLRLEWVEAGKPRYR